MKQICFLVNGTPCQFKIFTQQQFDEMGIDAILEFGDRVCGAPVTSYIITNTITSRYGVVDTDGNQIYDVDGNMVIQTDQTIESEPEVQR
jgi:hypothetical protein